MSQVRTNERVIMYFIETVSEALACMRSDFSARECTGEIVVSGVGHLLKASGASERAYFSVREVAKTVHLFCFVLQPNMTVVKVTRSYTAPWKFQQPVTNK